MSDDEDIEVNFRKLDKIGSDQDRLIKLLGEEKDKKELENIHTSLELLWGKWFTEMNSITDKVIEDIIEDNEGEEWKTK